MRWKWDLSDVSCPVIAPISSQGERPRWSVLIPVKDRRLYLERCLRSILQQDPGPKEMSIEVVDDGSQVDDIEAIVRRVAGARVTYTRQSQNAGFCRTANAFINRANGHWVHLIADDDMVMPGFYEVYGAFLEQHPSCGMLFCRVVSIDARDAWRQIKGGPPGVHESGILTHAHQRLLQRVCVPAPAAVVRRDVYEAVGGYLPSLPHAGDWEMWLRIARRYDIGFIHHPYLYYREHTDSLSNAAVSSGRVAEEWVRIVNTALPHVPPGERRATELAAFRFCSRMSESSARRALQMGHYDAAVRYAAWAWRFEPAIHSGRMYVDACLARLGDRWTRATKGLGQRQTAITTSGPHVTGGGPDDRA